MICKSGRERAYKCGFLSRDASMRDGDFNAEGTEHREITRRSRQRRGREGVLRANHRRW
jgi:hypothetical protein